jgi:hypothetical protein
MQVGKIDQRRERTKNYVALAMQLPANWGGNPFPRQQHSSGNDPSINLLPENPATPSLVDVL